MNSRILDVMRSFEDINDYYHFIFSHHDDQAWSKVASVFTVEARKQYLDAFPDGAYVRQCKDDINHINLWNEAQDEQTVESFEKYCSQYPNGYFFEQAQQWIQSLICDQADWRDAKQKGSLDDYHHYLKTQPLGQYRSQALAAIQGIEQDKVDWKSTKSQMSIDSLQTYLQKHPAGLYVSEANKWLKSLQKDDENWKKALQQRSEASFTQYLAGAKPRYHDHEANGRLEEIRYWADIHSQNTLTGYQDYMARYNAPLFSDTATSLIEKLEREAEAEQHRQHQRQDSESWQKALKQRSEQGFLEYLAGSEPLNYDQEAAERLEEVRYWHAINTSQNKLIDYQGYLSRYQQPLFKSEATSFIENIKLKIDAEEKRKQKLKQGRELKKRDTRSWKKAMQERSEEGFQAYLASAGPRYYDEEANKRIEEVRIWNDICTRSSIAAYQEYISKYEEPLFADEAHVFISVQKKKAKSESEKKAYAEEKRKRQEIESQLVVDYRKGNRVVWKNKSDFKDFLLPGFAKRESLVYTKEKMPLSVGDFFNFLLFFTIFLFLFLGSVFMTLVLFFDSESFLFIVALVFSGVLFVTLIYVFLNEFLHKNKVFIFKDRYVGFLGSAGKTVIFFYDITTPPLWLSSNGLRIFIKEKYTYDIKEVEGAKELENYFYNRNVLDDSRSRSFSEALKLHAK